MTFTSEQGPAMPIQIVRDIWLELSSRISDAARQDVYLSTKDFDALSKSERALYESLTSRMTHDAQILTISTVEESSDQPQP